MPKLTKHHLNKLNDIYIEKGFDIKESENLDSAINLLKLYSVAYNSKK